MLKKGIRSVFILLWSVLILCACSSPGLKDDRYFTSDIRDYETIWELSERRASETSILFPDPKEAADVLDFLCEHTTYALLGTGWQVKLHLEYDGDAFQEEVERIKKICKGSPVFDANPYFEQPAYASVWNWESCFEYAVICEKDHSICYVYLQLMEPEDVTVDEKFLPKNYEMEMQQSAYSVYSESL